jgi:hypothetical protein
MRKPKIKIESGVRGVWNDVHGVSFFAIQEGGTGYDIHFDDIWQNFNLVHQLRRAHRMGKPRRMWVKVYCDEATYQYEFSGLISEIRVRRRICFVGGWAEKPVRCLKLCKKNQKAA